MCLRICCKKKQYKLDKKYDVIEIEREKRYQEMKAKNKNTDIE